MSSLTGLEPGKNSSARWQILDSQRIAGWSRPASALNVPAFSS